MNNENKFTNPEFLLFCECIVHANTLCVQFPITTWCQNESTTLDGGGESASSLCFSPRLLWLPLLIWLRLSNLIELLKKICFLTLETSRYVWRLGVVIFGYHLPSLGSPCCNQGSEPQLWEIVFLTDTLLLLLFWIKTQNGSCPREGLQLLNVLDVQCLLHHLIAVVSNQSNEFQSGALLSWPHHMKVISSSWGRENIQRYKWNKSYRTVKESKRKRPWQWFVPLQTRSQPFLLRLSIIFRLFRLKASLFTQYS